MIGSLFISRISLFNLAPVSSTCCQALIFEANDLTCSLIAQHQISRPAFRRRDQTVKTRHVTWIEPMIPH